MLALEVEYLTGRAVASERHDRLLPEWPPHPGRLFSALVAALYESDLTPEQQEAGQSALRWLERLPPPALAVSPAGVRETVPVFVPVNDAESPEPKKDGSFSPGQIAAGLEVLPERRSRQQRTFPSVTPRRPTVWFLWREASPEEIATHQASLNTLLGNMTYLGHSSSLVRAAVRSLPADISQTYIPAEDGTVFLRIPAPGRLAELVRDYNRNIRPSPGLYHPYRESWQTRATSPAVAESVFGDMIVCRLTGPALPLVATPHLMRAVRDAVLAHLDRPDERVRTLVSGHSPDGGVSKADHIAYIPLPFVDHRHADGLIKGFALVLPRGLGRFSPERRSVLRALVAISHVGFGSHGPWQIDLPPAGEGSRSLSPDPYVGTRGGSRFWASVTPLLCDRFPKDKDGQRVRDLIAVSCERVVGIHPTRLEVTSVSRLRGVPPSHAFGGGRKVGDAPRHRVHALLEFDRPVRGPLLLGAGRFLGVGLFRACRVEGGRA